MADEVQAEEAPQEFEEDSGLRHRGTSAAAPPPPADAPAAGDDDDSQGKGKSENFMARTAKKYLPQVMGMLSKIETIINILLIIGGHLLDAYNKLYAKFEDKLPDQIVKCFTGFVLMFFGGFFITTVASIEAFRQGGSDRLWKAISSLRAQAKLVAEANEKDDKIDADGDGIADVLQISADELAQRKLLVLVRACDPMEVSNALAALYTCVLATVATLRVQFARTISLGAAIGDNIFKPVKKWVIPFVETYTEEDYHKWYPSIFGYICRAIGASIAFQIQRILSTVATAVRGGHMVIESSAVLAEYHGHAYLTDGYLDDILVWAFVALGIYFQLFIFTYLPFIIQLALLPLFIVEWILTTLVTTVPV